LPVYESGVSVNPKNVVISSPGFVSYPEIFNNSTLFEASNANTFVLLASPVAKPENTNPLSALMLLANRFHLKEVVPKS